MDECAAKLACLEPAAGAIRRAPAALSPGTVEITSSPVNVPG
jgi:hypothetical protein